MIGAFIQVREESWRRIAGRMPCGYLITESGCWQWVGEVDGKGYGRITVYGGGTKRRSGAHRYVYELHRGKIPDGLTLDHLCRNHGCVNPWHLEPVTRGENVLRGQTIPAANHVKTHCKYGHPLSGANLFEYRTAYYGHPGRGCRICRERVSTASRHRRHPKLTAEQHRAHNAYAVIHRWHPDDWEQRFISWMETAAFSGRLPPSVKSETVMAWIQAHQGRAA